MRRLARRVLGWLFERLYHELAFAYDLVSWIVSGGRWARWQRAALAYVKGRRVLEVGPGTGRLLAALRAQGYEAVAVERSPVMARMASRRAGAEGVFEADARELPFADASFDTVLGTFPAPYVFEDAFAREVARVLRPGGRLVLLLGAESGAYPWPGVLEHFLGWAVAQPGRENTALELRQLSGKHFFRTLPEGRLVFYIAERE